MAVDWRGGTELGGGVWRIREDEMLGPWALFGIIVLTVIQPKPFFVCLFDD